MNKISEAFELHKLAQEAFKESGSSDYDEHLEKLKQRIEKAEERQMAKSEGEKYLVEAKRALREGKIDAARASLNQVTHLFPPPLLVCPLRWSSSSPHEWFRTRQRLRSRGLWIQLSPVKSTRSL